MSWAVLYHVYTEGFIDSTQHIVFHLHAKSCNMVYVEIGESYFVNCILPDNNDMDRISMIRFQWCAHATTPAEMTLK